MERIPVSGPWITQKEIDYVTDAVTNAWYDNANLYNERFERSFAEYLDVNFAISLPSCTSAIHLSLLALGIGPGDEVIVPDVTWIATAAPTIFSLPYIAQTQLWIGFCVRCVDQTGKIKIVGNWRVAVVSGNKWYDVMTAVIVSRASNHRKIRVADHVFKNCDEVHLSLIEIGVSNAT